MKLISSLEDWVPDGVESAVTIGVFDGIHRGHQALLDRLQTGAREKGLRTIVLTFDQHPRFALGLAPAGLRSEAQITDLDEKLALLDERGVDLCAVIPVNGGVLKLEADAFIQQFLVKMFRTRLLVVGYDFRFGRGREGDVELLRQRGAEYGFAVVEAPAVLAGGQPVKSTRVRDCLRRGDMPGAAKLLGRPYQVIGTVVQGNRRGRQLGFPTINIGYSKEKLLPAPGVYAGVCSAAGRRWPAAVNLGTRPTMDRSSENNPSGNSSGSEDDGRQFVLEAHLIGFSGDLYGEKVRLEFGEKLRDEQRFPNVEALKEQIRRDVQEVERISLETDGAVSGDTTERGTTVTGTLETGTAETSTAEKVDGWSGPDDLSHVAPARSGKEGV